MTWDAIVVGAGMSGITAAQRLSQAGYRVLVLDKSRGLGGRMATRRVSWPDATDSLVGPVTVPVDHGCRFIQPGGALEADWPTDWLAQGILQPWQPAEFSLGADGRWQPRTQTTDPGPYYVAPQGMNTFAKALATGLSIQRQSRVTQVTPTDQGWRVDWVEGAEEALAEPLKARTVVLALPAGQIVSLVAANQHPALEPFLAAAEAVIFDPVITVMAGYAPTAPTHLTEPNPAGWMGWGQGHPVLRWIALDSGKRPEPPYPVVVAHSTASFAHDHFEAENLDAVGQHILEQAAQSLEPWLGQPDWMQVHRWRYGFVKKAHPTEILVTEAVPTLVGCGDWCVGTGAEGALRSGAAAAQHIIQNLEP
ncbi:MAG: NAD(P)/FAD-dependent oxidoreductase [Spirulina sp.]